MPRLKILFLTLFITGKFHGQNLDSLHKELQNTVISDISAVKKITDNLFRYDSFDEKAVYYLAESFKSANKNDSVVALFNRLKNIDSTNPQPYIFESLFKCARISLSDTSCLAPLKTAYRLNPKNLKTNRLLGTDYYDLFHKSFIKNKDATTRYYAQESKKYLVQLCNIDNESRNLYKYTITQLSNYLNDPSYLDVLNNTPPSTKYKFEEISSSTSYFPYDFLATLGRDWKENYKIDVLHKSSSAAFRSRWYSNKLYDMKESIVYNQSGKNIFRFIWLRSFHKPVVIRLEEADNKIQLTWKMASGAGGYETGELIVDKSKIISKSEFDKFTSLLATAKYWEMSPQQDSNGSDGAQWIIEGLQNGKYHFVDRWSSNTETDFQKCALYLLRLTDLEIPQKDIY
jgi:hypothetical protein